ncbi:MAG: hypothetical protein ACREIQ_03510, partial [Nitrospiria bacterium]
LAVFPQTRDAEVINAWFVPYIQRLFDAFSLDGYGPNYNPSDLFPMVFTIPPSGLPKCVGILDRDPASGETFLVYETKDGFVKVPFAIPPAP